MRIKKRSRLVTGADLESIEKANNCLREALMWLRMAEANNSADAVKRAIKSVDGARRHAEGRLMRQEAAYARVPAPEKRP